MSEVIEEEKSEAGDWLRLGAELIDAKPKDMEWPDFLVGVSALLISHAWEKLKEEQKAT